MKKYMEMTIEEALEYNKGNKNAKVIVAVSNLEDNFCSKFERKTPAECEEIIRESMTIAHDCSDLMNSLHCYSAKQNILEIKPIGIVSTILIKE